MEATKQTVHELESLTFEQRWLIRQEARRLGIEPMAEAVQA